MSWLPLHGVQLRRGPFRGSLNANVTRVLIAVALGLVTWMLVTWEQNPFREGNLPSTVPVEVEHLGSGLVEVGAPGDVQVKIRASQDAWSRLKTSDFKAYVDLNHVGAGIHTADVHVETSGEYQIVDWSPKQETIRLEPLSQRTVPVELHIAGKLADGYVLQSQTVTPSTVTITGQDQLVQQASVATVTTSLDGARGDVTESIAPVLMDDAGQPVKGLQFSPQTVRVFLGIQQQIGVKTVPVRVTTSGQVAAGFWLSALTVDPQTITIQGGPAALGGVDYIDLPALDLQNAKANVVRTTKLTPAAGYTFLDAGSVTVTATVTPLRTTEVLPIAVAIQGLAPGLVARLEPSTIEVTIGGLVPSLSALKPGDVSAVVQAGGLGVGSHTVAVRLNAPASVAIDGANPDRVALIVSAIPTPTQTTTPAPSGTPATGAGPIGITAAPSSGTATPTASPGGSAKPSASSVSSPSSAVSPRPS